MTGLEAFSIPNSHFANSLPNSSESFETLANTSVKKSSCGVLPSLWRQGKILLKMLDMGVLQTMAISTCQNSSAVKTASMFSHNFDLAVEIWWGTRQIF